MPGKLLRGLQAAGVPDAPKLAQQIFKSPLGFVKTNPPGSIPREAVVNAYRDVQKILCIIGVVLSACLIPITLFIDNVALDERTTLVKDTDSDTSDEIRHSGNGIDNKRDLNDMTPYEEKRDLTAINNKA